MSHFLKTPLARVPPSREGTWYGTGELLWMHRGMRTRDRDFQKSKLYRVEVLAAMELDRAGGWPMLEDLETIDGVRGFVALILGRATFARRWGSGATWRIEIGDGRRRRAAAGWPLPGRAGGIALPRGARKRIDVLHELAHAVTPKWEQHGRLFARTYGELVGVAFGREAGQMFLRELRAGGVKVQPRRGLPPDVRAALDGDAAPVVAGE